MIAIYLSAIDNEKNQRKFEAVYLKYKNLMLNRAYDILKDFGLAEDAVHNAFLRILKNLHKIDDVDNIRTRGFVLVTVDNVAKSMYNKENRITVTDYEELESETSVEEIVEDKDAVLHITEAMNTLPEIYRYVFYLKYFNKFSDREIATALDIPVATVRKRLIRGKGLLINLLKRGEDDE